MATPTLPADWTPTKQGCLRTSDFWIWDYERNGDQRTVIGGPTQITDCFPSTWDATVPYAGTGCPPQYTPACQGTDSAAAVTCCPTGAYSFSCQPETWLPGYHAEYFRCVSQHTDTGTIVVTRTAFTQNTLNVGTRTRSTQEHLFALAMVYTTPASMTTSSTMTGIPTADSASSSETATSLSPAQAAGVGAGVAVAVILVASFTAWCLWRRRRSSKPPDQPPSMIQYIDSPPPPSTLSPPSELPSFREPSELNTGDPLHHIKMHELPTK
ncbi:hypothetical protein F4819DRAFT_80148 [Hypoxylon fuscum]|nr:hypothetical protein F4819DRAFT_80148 [Hypoxylon fuscum]